MMTRYCHADEPDIEPIEIGDWVNVTYPRRAFEIVSRGFTGQITEIRAAEKIKNPYYRRKETTVVVRPKNPYRETEPVEVMLSWITCWRNKDGTKERKVEQSA